MISNHNILILAMGATIGAVGFAILFNLPPRLLSVAAIGGIIAVCTRNFLVFECHQSGMIGSFVGAVIISIIGVQSFRRLHAPIPVLTVPAVIPLVPGVLIYRLMFAIIDIRELSTEQLLRAIQSGVDSVLIIIGIAVGVATPGIFAQRSFDRQKLEEQERLLNKLHEKED